MWNINSLHPLWKRGKPTVNIYSICNAQFGPLFIRQRIEAVLSINEIKLLSSTATIGHREKPAAKMTFSARSAVAYRKGLAMQSLSRTWEQEVATGQELELHPWNVLHVRSNFERRVAEHLTIRAVEHYLPLYRERVRWSDRTVVTERPLFSGYIFARFPPEARITVISTPGVVRSLGHDEGSLVSYAELEKIRSGLASGLPIRPHPNMGVGARVRVRSGIFEGVEGVVADFRQQCKVVIALAAVRQCFSLELDLNDIEILKRPLPKAQMIPAIGGWSMSTPAEPIRE